MLSTPRLLIEEFVSGIKITDTAGLQRVGMFPTEVACLPNDVYAEPDLLARMAGRAPPYWTTGRRYRSSLSL